MSPLLLDQTMGVGWIALATASNSTLRGRDHTRAGYDVWNGSCGWRRANSGYFTEYPAIVPLRSQNRIDVTTLNGDVIRMDGDASSGGSGSGIWSYPNDDYSDGSHFLSGLLAAIVNNWGQQPFLEGPSVDRMQDFILEEK